ncbi:MAG TPA: VOC family protein [Verrucomicrobiae bacterium]|nr:VOC family protein [Verrucomicrobiae bacterium]
MAQKRTGESWIPADEYGRSLPAFTVNLIVSNLSRSLDFYRNVMGASVVYSDADFAALLWNGLRFMLHADHAYDRHAWHSRLEGGEPRGLGAELRMLHVNPDEVEARAKQNGATILQPSRNMPHGWRDVVVSDPDGYTWAIGMPR